MRRRPLSVVAGVAAAIVAGVAAAACDSAPADPGPPAERLRTEIVAVYPHDPAAFTQGLEVSGDELLEGTGLSGRSWIAARSLATGAERVRVPVPDDMFGEGITVAGATVWQLTWQDGVAIARDRDTLAERGRAGYDGEGWGLCAQDDRLVMSDGTAELTFRHPGTFAETGLVTVRREGRAATRLNELECTDDGAVYANVWKTDEILRIDPDAGRVTAVIDAGALREHLPEDRRERIDVLNGIAHLPGTDRFLVTGKYWPSMFEVRFVP
ncbi:glutaminyl-peptide cyclotransferase [Rhodococcus ruber]|uniref:glutaminyl-peptide cyclotransferase n=1 Tax=Rhodococcus TaxID=1827 RepID=UPI0007CD661C|nr:MULTISPECIES: glutaminyl-peptide cyclotransferase [Rhodococcus]AWH01581.1 glutaminyl-peptide cyclotransferase [Rhodococcus ruber]AXY50804.1 glutaminyl-peptide cyclotransferase [Rhodococcus ruber]UQB73938.1 glutaminyl-peptide cyclotransferase [Rhodococcus ruber]WML63963.1 glutaminyl-peptide cyclotransferase [Rhodococcus sp. AH-ZY2]